MARARSPDRDKAFKIWQESNGNILLKDIANQLGVSDGQIRKWKNLDKWDDKLKGNVTNNKSNVTIESKHTKKQNKKITKKLIESVEENEDLTEKQKLFCIYYVDNHNATQSYIKAFGSCYTTSMVEGCKLLRNPKVKAEIDKLKEMIRNELDIDVLDMLQYCLKVVGADIGDYVKFGMVERVVYDSEGPMKDEDGNVIKEPVNMVTLGESDFLDTSIITEVKQGKDGVSIKLADKKWAWEQLKQYCDWLPDKWKRKLEEDKLEFAKSKVRDLEIPAEPLILQPVYGKPPEAEGMNNE